MKHVRENSEIIQSRRGKDPFARYAELTAALGLPEYGHHHGYREGALPHGFDPAPFIRVDS
jgi:hypothetical protein